MRLTIHTPTMLARRTLTVSITPEQDALLRSCMASGRFASASEVVRAALRLLERDEAVTAVSMSPAKRRRAVRV